MPVNNVQNIKQITPITPNNDLQQTAKGDVSFSNVLKNALEKVNQAEHESNLKTDALAEGKVDDLHDVMLTAQKANVMIDTAVQFQQKAIDTYNEIMRMQV